MYLLLSLIKKFVQKILFLKIFILGYSVPVSVANGNAANASSPLGPRTVSPPEPTTGTGPQQQHVGANGSGQSPMAALMSVADNLPPGSPRSTGGTPPGNSAPRSASRGSQHSPNSSGKKQFCSTNFHLI